jgi:hypothetical protein
MKIKTQPINTSYAVTYDQAKQARKEYLKKNYRLSKKPWFVLVSGKQYNYETRHESWGDHTKWFRKPSETKILHDKNTIKPIGIAKYMESLAQHKLNKWIRNNPKPDDKQNLFYKEFLENWEKERDKALEHFRDVVVSIYDKTVLPFDRKKSLIVPMIDMGNRTYTYPNMDPLTIGYPLCRFAGKRFVKKNTIIDVCKETLKNVSKQYNCKSVDYTYERKVLLTVAA